MGRGIIRKPSFNKIVGAYRSQWKRFWMRLFTFGIYGSKGIGWWKNPKKAWYNFWYYRSSISVYKILGCKPSRGACFFAMLVASVASIFAAPVDATRAGVKAHKIKKERKARDEGKSTRTNNEPKATTSSRTEGAKSSNASSNSSYKSSAAITRSVDSVSSSKTPSSASSHKRSSTIDAPKQSSPSYTSTITPTVSPKIEERSKETYSYSFSTLFPKEEKTVPVVTKVEEPKEPDENTPKSQPKHECDQYIRKRMFIAGSSYCDKTVLESLEVGTYFDLEAEPDNPYDKDAVKLTYLGQKIGYIAKQDHLAFVTCLKLKRNIYGVITAIKKDEHPKKYEFETWFDNH